MHRDGMGKLWLASQRHGKAVVGIAAAWDCPEKISKGKAPHGLAKALSGIEWHGFAS